MGIKYRETLPTEDVTHCRMRGRRGYELSKVTNENRKKK